MYIPAILMKVPWTRMSKAFWKFEVLSSWLVLAHLGHHNYELGLGIDHVLEDEKA